MLSDCCADNVCAVRTTCVQCGRVCVQCGRVCVCSADNVCACSADVCVCSADNVCVCSADVCVCAVRTCVCAVRTTCVQCGRVCVQCGCVCVQCGRVCVCSADDVACVHKHFVFQVALNTGKTVILLPSNLTRQLKHCQSILYLALGCTYCTHALGQLGSSVLCSSGANQNHNHYCNTTVEAVNSVE